MNGGAIDNYGVMHIPLLGSPAIDHGNNADCLDTDQRGQHRLVNGVCDVGAVERQWIDFNYFVELPLVLR